MKNGTVASGISCTEAIVSQTERYEQAVAKLRHFEEVTGEALTLISDLLPVPVDDSTPAADLREALLTCGDPVVLELIKAAHRKGDGAMVLSVALLNVARLHTFAHSLAKDLRMSLMTNPNVIDAQ